MNHIDLIEEIDTKRCQTDIKMGGPFTFGVPRYVRCKNITRYIIVEISPGEDGLHGAMGICEKCKSVVESEMGEEINIFKIKT